MPENKLQSGLNTQQKTGFVFLLIFSLLAIGLGILQMRNNIFGPFIVRAPQNVDQASFLLDETSRLQRIDTDHDKINDYEELNFYSTSPYLPDSDSDGIDDWEEIQAGEDPLCPKGQSCTTEFEAVSEGEEETYIGSELAKDQVLPSDIVGDAGGKVLVESGILDLESISQDPQKLREMLLGTGNITEEQLAGISDEQLVDVFKEVLGDSLLEEQKQTETPQ